MKSIHSNRSNQSKKNKHVNLSEINDKLNELSLNKINTVDYNSRNKILSEKVSYSELKINKLISTLFGEKIENIEDLRTKNRSTFLAREEFEKYKTKSDEEFKKIWEEINKFKILIEEINNILKEKATLNDLEAMENVILQKTQELFMSQNKKFSHNSSVLKILQEQFKKLLELLSRKEEEKETILFGKKPMSGYSCASCETYIGELKNDKNKYVHWKRMPEKRSK